MLASHTVLLHLNLMNKNLRGKFLVQKNKNNGNKFLFLMFVFKNPNRALVGRYEMTMKKTVTRNASWETNWLIVLVPSGGHTSTL